MSISWLLYSLASESEKWQCTVGFWNTKHLWLGPLPCPGRCRTLLLGSSPEISDSFFRKCKAYFIIISFHTMMKTSTIVQQSALEFELKQKRISKPQGCAANVHLANVPCSSWRNREGKSASKVKKVKCLSCQHCACHQPSTQYTHRHTRRHTLNGRSTSSGRPESKPNCLLKASLPHVQTVTKWQF